jgi:hypothetical protein
MKTTFVLSTILLFASISAFSQDSLLTADYNLISKAYLTTIITKDTSWISEKRTQRMGGINRSGTFQTIPGYRIINVDFRCEDTPSPQGGACPWNYNPSGGYSKNITINAYGSSVTWSRRYDGAACRQHYTITYKKVEIADFWKDKLKFITDSDYNADSKVYLENTASLPITVRYKTEYSIGGVLHSTVDNVVNIAAYGKQFVGAKYIRNNDGNFVINYELYEVPFQ